jgi:hypothetical protein
MCSAGLLNIRTSGWKNYSPPTGENNPVAICTSPDGYICRVLFCLACVSGVLFFLKRWKKYFEILSWVGEVEALLQFLVCALACANCKCAYTCGLATHPK